MMTKTITCLYDTYDEAARAVRSLETAGVPDSDISLVANNADNRHSPSAAAATTDKTKKDAGAGAGIGAAVGGGAGLLAGLGMLAIPGVGPVVAAGWLVSTAAGAAVGAAAGGATGGLVGSLTNAGVSKEHAHIYAEGVRRGGTLVTARVDSAQAAKVEPILRQHLSIDPDMRGKEYRAHGWTAFDEKAAPYQRERVL
jgi:hypothetical protein